MIKHRSALALGSLLAVALSATTSTEDAAAAASISFTLSGATCSGDYSVVLRMTNGTIATFPAAALELGNFTGSAGALAPGASQNVTLTTSAIIPWRCNGTQLALSVKTASTTYAVPLARSTVDVDVEFDGMTHGMWLDPANFGPQRFSCAESDPTYLLRAVLIPFQFADDAEVWFEGGLTSEPLYFETSYDEQFLEVAFEYASGHCPHVVTDFEVHLDLEGNDEESADALVRPVSERAKGALVP